MTARLQINFTFPSRSGWWGALDRYCAANGVSRKRAIVRFVQIGLKSCGFVPESRSCESPVCQGLPDARWDGEACGLCGFIPAEEARRR